MMTSNHLPLVILVVTTTLLYATTLDTGLRPDELVGGDLITHQYAQVEARPSNAPGYPLYTMGGWLWVYIGTGVLSPLGQLSPNPTQILSSYSALWGVGALVMLYLILVRLTRWPFALLLTAFHGTTYFFWYYSVTTEQYTSAVFQTLLMIWLALKWDDRPSDRTLLAMAFLSGTMLANMVTTLFIMPPLLWFIFFRPTELTAIPTRRLPDWMLIHYLQRPWLVAQAIAVTALPLISYSYIYVRGAQHPEWRGQGEWASAWEWFVAFLTIQQGRDELGPGLSLTSVITAEFPSLMWQELTPFVFIGGLIGIGLLSWRQAILLYGTLLLYFIFCWAYRFGNWFQVIIPAYPLFTMGFAVLLNAEFRVMNAKSKFYHLSFIIQNSKFIIISLLLIYSLFTNYPAANQRYQPEDTGLDPGWAILSDQPLPKTRLLTDFEERVALQYLQTMWGLGDNVSLVTENDDSTIASHITRRAIIAQPDLLDLGRVSPQAVGEQIIALTPSDMPPTTLVNIPFGDDLQLIGWAKPNAAENWQLALYWQSRQPLTVNYTISVRPLVDAQLVLHPAGGPIIQDHQPVWGVYPTSQWRVNETVRDLYALSLPADITPNGVQIIVYRAVADGFETLGETSFALE